MQLNLTKLLIILIVIIIVYFLLLKPYLEPMILNQKIPSCFDISPHAKDIIRMLNEDKLSANIMLNKMNEFLCFHKQLINGESARMLLQQYILTPADSMSNDDLFMQLYKVMYNNLVSEVNNLQVESNRKELYMNHMLLLLNSHKNGIISLMQQQP